MFATTLLQNTRLTPLGMSWAFAGALLFVLVLGGAYLFSFLLRRMLGAGKSSTADTRMTGEASSNNPATFMAASMQAVIQKLREQEKELAALHQLERERAQQTERLSEAVTRNMPAGLLLISAAGLITSANPAAETALGVHRLAYRRYSEVLGEQSALAKLLSACLQEGQTFRREEIEYAASSGELRRLGVTISPILDNVRHVTGALCLLSDLTELAALQRQVRMKESLAALGELSAGIAHEFKNALATISGYAQMIRSEAQGDTAENAQRILEQTRALAHVVTEFLKFARPLDLSNEHVAVGPLIGRVVAEVHDAMPEVEISAAGDFQDVSGDEALLRQALLNLARNAAEAASSQPFGARVILRGSVEQTGGHSLQHISVSDNGPGIAAADLSKIFMPFYTTKTNGTGLGLAIVQKIVVQHGGSVEARNQPQGGAEFIVWLPLDTRRSTRVDSAAVRV